MIADSHRDASFAAGARPAHLTSRQSQVRAGAVAPGWKADEGRSGRCGGTAGTFGTPASAAQWRAVNLAAAALLLAVALLPVASLPLRQRRWPRRFLRSGTAIAATAALTATGLLSTLHVIGRLVIF